MDRKSGRLTDFRGLQEEAGEEQEKLLKDSDTQDSWTAGAAGSGALDHCTPLTACTGSMFRSRQTHDKGATGGGRSHSSKEVSIPLVRERDSEEAAAIKAVQAQESKRRKRRIMKIAVYFMFGVIALGVFALWLFYKDPIEFIRFDNDFVFTVRVQSLEVKTEDQETLLYGELGLHIKASPFHRCLNNGTLQYEPNCLYWKHKAYLRVSRDDNVTSNCYTVSWEGIAMDFLAEDCFYLQKYNWFGYVKPDKPFWPISGIKEQNITFYKQYPEEQNVNLVPNWLGSQGIAIFVHSSYPFSIAWNNTEKRQFCILSQLTVKKEITTDGPGIQQLKYTICKGKNLTDVYYNAQYHRHSWEAELKKNHHTIQPLLDPLLAVSSSTDAALLMSLLHANITGCSFLQLPTEWEENYGDLQFGDLAQELKGLLMLARKKGCGMILPTSTFFTFNSRLFEEGIEQRYFLRDELNLVTKMVQWKEKEGAVLDTTNPDAVRWYLEHIAHLLQNSSYNIQALKLMHIDIPQDATFYDTNMTFLDYTRLFYRDASMLLNVTLIEEHAMGFVSEPVFVLLHTNLAEDGGYACFYDAIPWVLTLGAGGYPLVIADASNLTLNPYLDVAILKRWLELAIFFPAFQIPNLPLVKDPTIVAYLKKLMEYRKDTILPHMQRYWSHDHDAPLLRPLWWHSPTDHSTQRVANQFLLGNDLLVAPILCNATRERSVYLPPGRWRAKDDEIHQGPKTLHVTNYLDLLDEQQNEIVFREVEDSNDNAR